MKNFIEQIKLKILQFKVNTPIYLKIPIIIIILMLSELIIKSPIIYVNSFKDSLIEISTNLDFIQYLDETKIDKAEILNSEDTVVFIKLISNQEYVIFKDIQKASFIYNLEKIIIDKKIPYEWKDYSSEIETNFPFIYFVLTNLSTLIIVFLILFLMGKQGLLFNKDKFEIFYNDDLSEKEKLNAMNSLVGMEDIKKELLIIQHMISNKETFKERGINNTFNYLFSGHSGTGKTKIALALSKTLGIPFITGTGNIETGIVGGGATVIKNLFKVARDLAKSNKSKMVLVFLDEAQTLLLERGQQKEKWADDSANELLAQLDGIHSDKDIDVIFIAASNFDDKNHKFDKAMMRRFQKKIFFRLPNLEERIELYKFYISKINSDFVGKINFPYIAEISSKSSPAQIETIVKEATLLSIEENSIIDTKLLELSFERIYVGKTDRKTTDKQEKTRKIVSLHELGHFICHFQNSLNSYLRENDLSFNIENKEISNYNLGYFNQLNKEQQKEAIEFIKKDINVLKISIESVSQINALGYVLNKSENESLKTRNQLEEDIISLYGGLASEKFFSKRKGDFSTGSSNDIEKVSFILDKMINKYSMYSKHKLNLSQANIDMKRTNTKIMCELSEKLYNVSFENISIYKDIILSLNELLLYKYVIKIEDVLDIIFKYYKKEETL